MMRALLGRRAGASATIVTRSLSGQMDMNGTEVTMVPMWRLLLGLDGPA